MTIWVDAHLSPRIAHWLSERFDIKAVPVRDLGMCETPDREIFEKARAADVILMTKDLDFVELVERLGPPPRVLWLTCGNTSERKLQEILGREFETVRELFESGEALVEIH